jgi:threonine/homoserine/homoserine lactone efflux protein
MSGVLFTTARRWIDHIAGVALVASGTRLAFER